jgi:hypothetical protein
MYYAYPECGLVFGREEGYFTGATIVSYVLAVPPVALLTWIVILLTGWRFDAALLVAALYFLPFVPTVFRYSRVCWMHFDRVVDPTLESERYVQPHTRPMLSKHDLPDEQEEHRSHPAA